LDVEIVCDANRELRSHSLSHSPHDLPIAARVAVHHHRAVKHKENAIIGGTFLQALDDPAHHGVETPIVDRTSGNSAVEMNRIQFNPLLRRPGNHSRGVDVALRGCFEPFLSIAREGIRFFEVRERGLGEVEAVRLVTDTGYRNADRSRAWRDPGAKQSQ